MLISAVAGRGAESLALDVDSPAPGLGVASKKPKIKHKCRDEYLISPNVPDVSPCVAAIFTATESRLTEELRGLRNRPALRRVRDNRRDLCPLPS